MPKYRKLPLVVEANRLTRKVTIETLEGVLTGDVGDWLIIGIHGEPYPCKDDVFRETYELVKEENET